MKKNLYNNSTFFLFLIYINQLIMVRNRGKPNSNNIMRNILFETWFDSLSNEEKDQDMINSLDKAALWSSS